MNPAHLHLVVNHLPIIGTLFGILILLSGFLLRNSNVKRTAMGAFVLTAGFAALAYFTGEGAEETIEGLAGVSESFIGPHEEMADFFLAASGIVGALALLTLIADLLSWKLSGALYAVVAIASIATMYPAAETGSTGGAIRHTEIRADVAQNSIQPANGEATGSDEEEDDD
ncbi:MAG: hypothetical protein IPL49_14150 [Saprospirales bacterium]|nr:hypothetical protein [Saprospirales bacterium]MBK8491987.1 hypothetical protein [Saprospirales bacterium]